VADAAIICAIFGGYDLLKPVCPQTVDVELVLVTDDPGLGDHMLGWRVVYTPVPDVPPMRAAKQAKLCPWEYIDAGASVWIDGSVMVTSPTLVADFLAAAAPVASFTHPDRDCLYLEAEASAGLGRYAGEPVLAQAACYRAQGHPEHWGLWETTILARRHTPEVVKAGYAWQAEISRWSSQDQVSFPYVMRQAGLRPAGLPGRALGSRWHQWGGSWRHFE
jgi:TOD1/MUCI70, glycosyltransferase-like domain